MLLFLHKVHPKNFDKARENTRASKSNLIVKVAFTFKIPQLLAYCGYKVQRILFVDFSTSLPLASISSQQIFFHVFSLFPWSHVLQGSQPHLHAKEWAWLAKNSSIHSLPVSNLGEEMRFNFGQ